MTKWVVLGLTVIAIAAMAVALWLRSGPDASQFADLAKPRLIHLDNQRMLVVEATGDPNVVAGGAFKRLFAAYYGRYALPVARELTILPTLQPRDVGLRRGR